MSSSFDIFKYGLLNFNERAKDSLFGEKQSVQPGQDTMRRSDEGLVGQSMNFAGGVYDSGIAGAKDYAFGKEKLVSSPSIGQTERPGFKGSEMDQDINKGIDTGIKYFDKGVKASVKKGNEIFDKMFPSETNTGSISKADKEKFMTGYGEGKVDPKLVEAMKEKTSPLGQKDVGTLEKIMGVDFDTAKANWKDKGGFEGLMSNPAFTLGLALMQSSANGKTINQGILDNFVKSAKISTEFKDRLEAKQGGVIEATEGQMDDIKSVLGTKGIDKPGWWRKILPGNQSEGYEQAVEDVAVKVQIKVKAMKKAAKNSGKDIVVGKRLYKKIIDDMIASGEIKNVGGVNIGGYQVIDSTLEAKAKGGPVESGKPYVVGEKGPEIIIPTSDGNVLSNDDSQIFNMLLASNPQLQKVSRQRAEKIMRNRFPEYFEG